MDETYVIAFAPGTSGKFLSNIFWEILQQENFDWSLSSDNTCHLAHLHTYSHGVVLDRMISNTKEVYDLFKFDTTRKNDMQDNILQRQGTGLLNTHAWPEFDVIRSNPNFKHTKFIIVTIDRDSLWEVFLNDFFKNMLVTLNPDINDPIKTLEPFWLVDMYNIVFESDITYNELFDSLTPDKIEKLARFFYETAWSLNPDHLVQRPGPLDIYRNPVEIPEDFKEKTLLLEYKEVYIMSESLVPVAVEKMAEFMKQSLPSINLRKRKVDKTFFTESVVRKCNMYLEGRQNQIEKYKSYNLM